LDEQAEDALAAIHFLAKRPEIEAAQIGLYGPSQGGWAAVKAASKSEHVRFLILHSGPSVSVFHQELDRVKYSMLQEKLTPDEIDAATKYTEQLLEVAATGKGFQALQKAAVSVRATPWKDYVQFADRIEDLQWFHDNNYDPGQDLRQLKIPVLALYGGNDPLVPPAENVALLRSFLDKAGNKDVTITVFPRASHAIEVWNTLRGDEWEWPEHYWMWNKKAPGYYETLFGWLDSHVRQ
jgi:pimeloyl-ACP methyl ester carboxylesterase